MKQILNKVAFLFSLIKKGEYAFLWSGISKRINSKNVSYVLKRNLNEKIPAPPTLLKLSFRHYKKEDAPYFDGDNTNDGLVDRNIDHCFVATKDNIPVYRVWLMGASQNKKIHDFWGSFFAPLNPNEVLVENSYTVPKYRGFGIMSYAVAKIAEKGLDVGADTAVMYTSSDHLVSLRAGDYAGFHPFKLRKIRWFLFNQKVTYGDITEDLMEHYRKVTKRRQRRKPKAKV